MEAKKTGEIKKGIEKRVGRMFGSRTDSTANVEAKVVQIAR